MNFREEIYHQFKNTIIPADQKRVADEFDITIARLIEENIPKRLFRFRPCNTLNFDALLRNKCYASAPTQFNDPFDSFMPTNDTDIEEMYAATSDVVAMRESLEKTGKLPDALKKIWDDETQERISKQLMNIKSELIPKVATEAKEKALKELSRVREDSKFGEIYVQNHAYVACFCEDISSILMWSHYADYHKGFALEYDFWGNEINGKASSALFPVLYSNEPYNAKEVVSAIILKKQGYEVPVPDTYFWLKAALFKAKEWEYENEWRLLKFRKEDEPLYTSIDLIPSAIYYGCRISSADYNILHNIAKQLGLKEYKMHPMKGYQAYKMLSEEIK